MKNLPDNAGDVGLIPGLGRLHMPQCKYTQWPTITERVWLNYWSPPAIESAGHNHWARTLRWEKPRHWEACIPQLRVIPDRCHYRKPICSSEDPAQPKIILKWQPAVNEQRWPCMINVLRLPWWLGSKESTCNVGDAGLIPGSGRSPGEGNGNPLQHSCLGNPMDCIRQAPLGNPHEQTGAWLATVHGVAKSWTWLSNNNKSCIPIF